MHAGEKREDGVGEGEVERFASRQRAWAEGSTRISKYGCARGTAGSEWKLEVFVRGHGTNDPITTGCLLADTWSPAAMMADSNTCYLLDCGCKVEEPNGKGVDGDGVFPKVSPRDAVE